MSARAVWSTENPVADDMPRRMSRAVQEKENRTRNTVLDSFALCSRYFPRKGFYRSIAGRVTDRLAGAAVWTGVPSLGSMNCDYCLGGVCPHTSPCACENRGENRRAKRTISNSSSFSVFLSWTARDIRLGHARLPQGSGCLDHTATPFSHHELKATPPPASHHHFAR